jgi:hypothetical protein
MGWHFGDRLRCQASVFDSASGNQREAKKDKGDDDGDGQSEKERDKVAGHPV